jgi:SAM-dependent methyltransferase
VVGALRPLRLAAVMWRRLAFAWMYRTGRTPWDTGVTPPEVVDLIEGADALPAGRALDLGCGTGTNVRYLADRGWDATGVDAEPRAVERAVTAIADVPNARVLRGDLTRLDALGLEGPFDLVLDIGCFHGIGRSRRDAYVAGVAARTRLGATLFLYAFPVRGVIPVGVSASEIAHRFAPAFEPVGRILGKEPPGSAYYRLVRTDRP